MSSYRPVNNPSSAKPVVERIQIIDLDRRTVLNAQYNPKEIQVDRSADWTETPNSKGNQPELTYASTKGRTLSLELMFDTYEAGEDVHEMYVKHLVGLMDVINAEPDAREDEKRPPRVQLAWGGKMPKFIGVVASVSTKYTLFLPGGTPVRAICTCKFTEANRHSSAKP
jgi:hypothetical protein